MPTDTGGDVTTMKAMVRDAYCSPDALRLGDIDKPVAGDDDVLVRVHAAGVDQGVWHLVTGLPYVVRIGGFGLLRPGSRVPGLDVAGRVEAVGRNVTRFRPGDEVFGTCGGSFAEYACAREDRLARKPANVTFEQAAAVPASAVAALQGLRDRGQVRAGQRVLVIGAGGGVGTFAVQLAKAFGADVTGVCGTTKTDLVRSIGADDVIDYTREDFADGARRYDLILDTAGRRSLSRLRRALTPRGTLVIVGGEGGGRWLQGTDRQLRALLLAPFVRQRLRALMSAEREEDLRYCGELIEAGKVTPIVDRTYPLSEVPEAIRYLRGGHARGKVVITV
ncbi:NAD(P)-dependent alcohol dehydrogenase [Streptosporangium minutum]|uniref:NAD(P)-dependent alcohol dehydrogenase n=1 Tax=Streptosporangium minutum TaxID=569862 RepID=A0A243RKR9_9ACTN|nr:NAD(P)-dependent alcohol dehydrogenase [Streptosporangium minutum]OUC95483.1 NAD(P)-dependent alcohol dehydrogenase [Streptosporangium minutum]